MPVRIKLRKPTKYWEALVDEEEKKPYLKAGFSLAPTKKFGKWKVYRKKRPWELFEDEVLSFARDGLALTDTDGGPTHRLGGHQIDASGGLDDFYLVFESKSKKELGARPLRPILRTLWTKKREISREVKIRYGRKYKRTLFILVLDQLTPTVRDEEYARRRGILVWPESYLDSLKALYFAIGNRVRYYVLRELAVEPPRIRGRGAYLSIPAIEAVVGTTRLYSFFLTAEALLDLAYVLRVESRQKKAYQRLLDKSRLAKIASYIEDGNSFKNSIVVGLDPRTSFVRRTGRRRRNQASLRAGNLRLPLRYASMWVIDGQHRLYGYARSDKRTLASMLPVVGMKTRNRTEEARTFVDINRNQKPVNPNLLWYLFGELQPEETEGIIAQLVKAANNDPRSPIHEKVYIPGVSRHARKSYRIFHANLCDTISDHLLEDKSGGYGLVPKTSIADPDERAKRIDRASAILRAYFRALSRASHKAKGQRRWMRGFFLTNNGINVAVRLLAQILKHTEGKADFSTVAHLVPFLSENAKSIDEMRRRTSSEGTRAEEAYRMILGIRSAVPDFAESFVREHRKDAKQVGPYDTLMKIESALREVIRSELEALTPNWWDQRVHPEIRLEAELRKERRERLYPWTDERDLPLVNYLDFNDYARIICKRDNWRESFQRIFKDEEWLRVTLRQLDPIRKDIAHSREVSNLEVTILESAALQLATALSRSGYESLASTG